MLDVPGVLCVIHFLQKPESDLGVLLSKAYGACIGASAWKIFAAAPSEGMAPPTAAGVAP